MKRIHRFAALALAVCLALGSGAADFSTWGKKAAITFSGYTGAETLTNFPALVVLGSGTISGSSSGRRKHLFPIELAE